MQPGEEEVCFVCSLCSGLQSLRCVMPRRAPDPLWSCMQARCDGCSSFRLPCSASPLCPSVGERCMAMCVQNSCGSAGTLGRSGAPGRRGVSTELRPPSLVGTLTSQRRVPVGRCATGAQPASRVESMAASNWQRPASPTALPWCPLRMGWCVVHKRTGKSAPVRVLGKGLRSRCTTWRKAGVGR